MANPGPRTEKREARINPILKRMPELAVSSKEIRKSYFEGPKSLEVLKGINFEIRRGEIVAVMGPSGAGKSTLLHIVGLMDQSTSGDLTLFGWNIQDLKEKEVDELRRKSIGFVFQFHHLLPELTVLENALLPMRMMGVKSEEAVIRATEILESVGLKERLEHFPSEISGGEQQRAALARALANQPELLVCDEPTGNLDLERGEEVRDLIWRAARARRASVLIATHNPDIAAKADRILHVVDGKVMTESDKWKGEH